MTSRTPLSPGVALLAAVVAALVLALVAPTGGQQPVKKRPAPDAAALGQAEAVLAELFATKLKEALKDKAVARELADYLLTRARITHDDDALRFAGLKRASELAAQGGDNAAALEAVEELARSFTVDTLDLKAAIYARVEKETTNKEDAIALTEMVLGLLDDALAADHFATADKLLAVADKAVVKTGKLQLASRVEGRGKEIKEAKAAAEAVKPFVARVAKNPDDAEAHREVGRYLCFLKGRFDKGLPLLARGDHAELKKLALRDLAAPAKGKLKADLAHDWYKLAKSEKGLAQRQLFRRALHWYQLALPEVEGLTQDRVQMRAEELTKLFPVTGATLTVEIAKEQRVIGQAHQGQVNSVAVSADGKVVMTGSYNEVIARAWDAATGQKKQDFRINNGAAMGVAVSADGKLGLTGSNDNTLRLWNLQTGQEVRRFNGHGGAIRAVQFVPGGKYVISGCDDGQVRVFDLNNGNLVRRMAGHTAYMTSVAVSKDGKRAATSSSDNTARIWNLETGQEVRRLQFTLLVQHVALSADGKRAVTTSYDNTVKVWDVDNNKVLHTLAHPGMVWQVAISPDSRRVYTASGGGVVVNGGVQPSNTNNLVRVFDLQTGKELRTLSGHTQWVMTLTLSADGRVLVTGAQDGTVRLWGAK